MKSKKIIATIALAGMLATAVAPAMPAFADQFNVISIGANLTQQQQQEMLNYFNAKPGSYEKVMINNQEEQAELKGILPESEIGTRTISCAYVQPTQSGGINVKTANLTYVTAGMISNALTTAGIYNANVVAAAPFEVSGTGALTGIMESFEKATGEKISPQKKELANKELATTAKIAADPNVGQAKATAVVSGVKAQVVQKGEKDQSQIAQTINNVTNNYGVQMTPEQKQDLNNLMQGISKQKYNTSEMMQTLDKLEEQSNKILEQQGQLKGMINNLEVHFDDFVGWIKSLFDNATKDAGIVNQTNNNSQIGKTAVVTANSNAVQGVNPAQPIQTQQPEKSAQQNQGTSIKVDTSSNTHINAEKPEKPAETQATDTTNNQSVTNNNDKTSNDNKQAVDANTTNTNNNTNDTNSTTTQTTTATK